MNSTLVFAFAMELILLLRRKIKIAARLDRYAISKVKKETTLFDDIFSIYDNFIRGFSKVLYKLKIFNNYALRYQKYITKENKDHIDKMDFISKKILLTLIFIIILTQL